MTIRITSPQFGYDGDVAGVHFRNGTAEVDTLPVSTEHYLLQSGYKLHKVDPDEPQPTEPEPVGDAVFIRPGVPALVDDNGPQPQPEGVEPISAVTPEGEDVPKGSTGGDGPSGDAKRPPATAKVADWRAYAVSQGATEDEAAGLTKDQLIERFGKEADQ